MSSHPFQASHIAALQDVGDLSAPKGSVAWARAVHGQLLLLLGEADSTTRAVRGYLKSLAEHKGYQLLDTPEGHPFPSMHAFAVTRKPFGLGYDPDVILAIVSEAREIMLDLPVVEYAERTRIQGAAQQTTGEVRPEGRPRKLHDSCSLPQKERAKQNGVSYQTQQKLDRLAREYPAMHRLVAEGQLTVAAAERAAGLAKKKSPLDQVKTLWHKASHDDRQQIMQWIQEQETIQE